MKGLALEYSQVFCSFQSPVAPRFQATAALSFPRSYSKGKMSSQQT